MENRQAEFQLLEREALRILTDETEPSDDYRNYTIYVSVMPSFGDYLSWSVFADAHETAFVLRKIAWQRTFDIHRFRDPLGGLKHGWSTKPTISIAVTELPSTTLLEMLSQARSLELPERDRKYDDIVLDGTRWFVFVERAFGNVSHHWNTVPPEWESLARWTQQLVAILDRSMEVNKP